MGKDPERQRLCNLESQSEKEEGKKEGSKRRKKKHIGPYEKRREPQTGGAYNMGQGRNF